MNTIFYLSKYLTWFEISLPVLLYQIFDTYFLFST